MTGLKFLVSDAPVVAVVSRIRDLQALAARHRIVGARVQRVSGTLAVDAAPRASVNGPVLEIVLEIHRRRDRHHGLAVGVGGAAGEPGAVDGLAR